MKNFKKTLALLAATTCLMASILSPIEKFFPSDFGVSTLSYFDLERME